MKKKNQIYSDDFGVNFNRTLRFLSFRPRSEKEINDYLKKKKVNSSISQKVIAKLKESNFLNDVEFAKWWIEQRTLIKPRAWRIIKIELKQKGISSEIIEELNINSKSEETSDLTNAIKLAQKRFSRYKSLPRQEINQKLGRFLISKGFDYDTVKRSIDEVFSKEYN
jgi:regulatory protein